MKFFKNLFGKKQKEPLDDDFSEEEYERDYEQKKKGLEDILGPMHEMVGHAIIPFAVGGAVDMYYFPNHGMGTGFATMELLDPNGNGPKPNRVGTYELVSFTKHNYIQTDNSEAAFNKIERRVCGNFTTTGFYSFEASLNPGDTCEIPMDNEDNRCMIFDKYPSEQDLLIGEKKHHLLLCLEIFRSEMTYARKEGSDNLFKKLKAAGYYPYSDLDREPVV